MNSDIALTFIQPVVRRARRAERRQRLNALDRLLAVAVVAASTASILELWPQIGPQSDLWRVPAYLHGINELRKQTEEIDRRHSALQRIGATRHGVIEALRKGRLLAAQALDGFRELDVL